MKTRSSAVVVLALIATTLLLTHRPAEPIALVEVRMSSVEQAMKTAKVVLPEGTATCFPIAERFGCVAWLTCGHVVEALPEFVQLPNGDQVPVLLAEKHPKFDVGLLWTGAILPAGTGPIPLRESAVPIGTLALHAGYPAGLGLWMSQGLIGAPDDGHSWTSVPIYYGCSGGPVIVDGQVVGVGMGVFIDGFRRQVVSNITAVVMVVQFRDWLNEALARDPR